MSHTYKSEAIEELLIEVSHLEDRIHELESDRNKLREQKTELERVLANLQIDLTQGGSPSGAGDNME